MKKLHVLSITLFALVFFACNTAQKQNAESDDSHADSQKSKDCSEVHWSHHQGAEGPENWANLCDGFTPCGGKAQSPIDIVENELMPNENLKDIHFEYFYSAVDIINNGHTVQFNTTGENSITIDSKKYDLLQFHYHALSEHTLNGKHAPIEVHFVHKHSDTDFAVIGMMFTEGKTNPLFESYLAHFPKEKGEYTTTDSLNLGSLLPEDLSYYYYSGSLTTPPCSEVVSWYVLKSPIEASNEQIEEFSEILHNNYRPVMPLNNRQVYSYSVSD